MNNCNDLIDNHIKYISDLKKKNFIESYNLLNLGYQIINNEPNIEDAFRKIQYETLFNDNLIINNEYIYCWELFPNNYDIIDENRENIIQAICKLNVNKDLINKTSVLAQNILENIFNKTNININLPKIISELWRKSYFNKYKKCNNSLYNYIIYDYLWFDPKTYDVINKKSISISFEKDNKYYILGIGFDNTKIKEDKKFDNFLLISIIVFIIIFILLYYFILRNNINYIGYFIYIFISIFIFGLIYTNKRSNGSFEFELLSNQEQYTIIIGIASIVIGMSISLRELGFKNNNLKILSLKILTISFILLIFIIILRTFKKNGEDLYFFIRIRYLLIYLSVFLVSVSIILFVFSK